ncbi:MAG TPA: tetratricopeptide repeat protein, partial [Candidatus Obscuribacterales bacterium]
EKRYKLAQAVSERTWGSMHRNTATATADLGVVYLRKKDYDKAESALSRALALRRKQDDQSGVFDTLILLAAVQEGQNRFAEAEATLKEALALKEKTTGAGDTEIARTLEFLASSYWKQGKYARAEPLLRRALKIRDEKPAVDRRARLNCLNNLAAVLFRQGKFAESESLYKRMLEIQERSYGKDHLSLNFTLDNYARLLRATGRSSQADELERRAARLRGRAMDKNARFRFDRFARAVTFHLLDESYTSYESSQARLHAGELSPSVLSDMKERGLVPADQGALKARAQRLAGIKQTCQVEIEEVVQGEPNHDGFVPVRVRGTVTVKSTVASGLPRSTPFDLQYLMGISRQTNEPVVAVLQGLPPVAEPDHTTRSPSRPSRASAAHHRRPPPGHANGPVRRFAE